MLTNLAIGPYRLEVSKAGFSAYIRTGIMLQVESLATVDVSLKLSDISEQVQVEAGASLVETQSTNVGAVIENQRILELPLDGRQATNLIQLADAAVPQGVAGPGGFPNTGQIVIAGGRSASDSIWTAACLTIHGITPTCRFLFPMRCRSSKSNQRAGCR